MGSRTIFSENFSRNLLSDDVTNTILFKLIDYSFTHLTHTNTSGPVCLALWYTHPLPNHLSLFIFWLGGVYVSRSSFTFLIIK